MNGYQELSDKQWSRLKPLSPYGSTGQRGGNANNRVFINALNWLARSDARWRDLSARYGSYAAIKIGYYQWVARAKCDFIESHFCSHILFLRNFFTQNRCLLLRKLL